MQKLFDTGTKTGIDAAKTTFRNLFRKAAEATGDLIGNKIAEKIVKPKPLSDLNSRNVEEIVIPPKNIKGIETGFTKWSTIKYLNY